MDSGNSGSLPSSSGGDGDINHHTIPILQPPSNFFNPSSFSHPLNPNPYDLDSDSVWSRNPTPNPIHNSYTSNAEKLGVITKNPKKRTRASRRAPTTVLTTDTTNFRQMVQEFTGIPAAPFSTSASSSSASFSRRLDLYGSGMAPMVKPSAQKGHVQVQVQTAYSNNISAPTSILQLPPSETYGVTKQPLNLSNLQNQMFPFQSFSEATQVNNVREHSDAFVGSSSMLLKRWRGESENFANFEGRNENGNSQNVVVPMRNDGGQLRGNEDSWICPSD
ncbi:putative VQ motif-containing protein [Helianthus annuus]|nr:putative VQ motif-containing protein [Helianthus annuus]